MVLEIQIYNYYLYLCARILTLLVESINKDDHNMCQYNMRRGATSIMYAKLTNFGITPRNAARRATCNQSTMTKDMPR